MKKFLAIVLVLAILGACGFAAYKYFDSRPLFDDFDTAKANLEDAGYAVYISEKGDSALYYEKYAVRQLTATKSNDNDDDDTVEGLSIIEYQDAEYAKIAYKEYKIELDYMIDFYTFQLDLTKYELENNKDLSERDIESYNKRIEAYTEYIEEYEKYVIGYSGTYVWVGTQTAIDASKGK